MRTSPKAPAGVSQRLLLVCVESASMRRAIVRARSHARGEREGGRILTGAEDLSNSVIVSEFTFRLAHEHGGTDLCCKGVR